MRWPVRLVIVRHGQSEQNAALDLLQASSLPHLLPLHFFSEKFADQRLLPAKQPDIDKLITIRPELRYEHSYAEQTYDNGTRKNQVTAQIDFVLHF